jgi:hypothetical protein
VSISPVTAKHLTADGDQLAPESDDDSGRDPSTVEDVPYVQVLGNGVSLYGAFWHSDFGRQRGRRSVGLSPPDAAWLFAFTAPHLPAGWSGVEPTALEPGTIVRIRTGLHVQRDFPVDKPKETVIQKPKGEAP